jgi:prepilin-type N-terminal cleavage/methylation domain-containing protein
MRHDARLDARLDAQGFTLLELAVALFLLALLFGGMFVPLQAQLDARKTDETELILHRAREALLGYAAANGYFPCPADNVKGGIEATAADHATGTCPAYYGYLPAATLGLQPADAQGYAIDAWGSAPSRIRYAVSPSTVGKVSNAFTRVNGMRSATIANLGDPALSLMHVCGTALGVREGTSCGAGETLVSTAPVVIWSLGPNGATGGTSRDEAQNPNANGGSADRIFVSRVRGDGPGGEFDDQLVWIGMPALIARMVAAGQLP